MSWEDRELKWFYWKTTVNLPYSTMAANDPLMQGPRFADNILNSFILWKLLYFNSYFIEICSQWQYIQKHVFEWKLLYFDSYFTVICLQWSN